MRIKKGDTRFLGEKISVTVTCPKGMVTADCPVPRPVSCGYADMISAFNGGEQAVYILGADTALKSFKGTVIGVISREKGEDIWAVVPDKLVGADICYECNVMHEVEPLEKGYKSKFLPKYEKTGGAIMFRYIGGERKYLLLKSKRGHIGFPKGHIEYGETELMNAEREIREETGLKFVRYGDFRSEYTYTTLENSIKTGVFFLSEFNEEPIYQEEEVKAHWLVGFEEAMELLNFPEDRELLKEAEGYLSEENKP